MRLNTVTIRKGCKADTGKWVETCTEDVPVIESLGSFAITPGRKGALSDKPLFNVTHVPTGLALLKDDTTLSVARRVLRAAQRLPGDWTAIADPKDITREQKAAGRALRTRYQTDMAVMTYDDWKSTDPRDREPVAPSMPYRCCESACAGLSFRGADALRHHRDTGHALRGRNWPPHWPDAQWSCCSWDSALRNHLAGVRT